VSDQFGQQPAAPSFRVGRSHAPTPSLSPGADAHVDDFAAAYALGALEPDERDLVDFHIRFCPRCAAAVEADLRAANALPFLSPPAIPRPQAKASLFVRVAAEGMRPPASLPAPAPEPIVAVAPALYPQMPTLPISRLDIPPVAVASGEKPASRGAGWYVGLVSLPLLLALVATGFWGASLQQQLASQGNQVVQMQAQMANFGSGITPMQLSGGTLMPQAEGQLFLGADEKRGMVQFDLNSREAAGTYDIWAVQNGQLVSAGQVQVDAEGKGRGPFELAQPFKAYEDIVVQPRSADGEPLKKRRAVLTTNAAMLGSTGSALDAAP
jgi:hypothetical protein